MLFNSNFFRNSTTESKILSLFEKYIVVSISIFKLISFFYSDNKEKIFEVEDIEIDYFKNIIIKLKKLVKLL